MTIRSGGRARERSQAHPAEPGTYEGEWRPEPGQRESGGSGGGPTGGGRRGGNGNGLNGYGNGNGRRRGIPAVLKFLVFALILAGFVLVALVTVLRPLIRNTVVGWAADNPAALGMPFVADLVREDLGPKLTDPASEDRTQVQFVVSPGENAAGIAARLEDGGFLSDKRSFIFIATQKGLTQDLATGTFILRKSMTPDQIVQSLLSPEQIPYVDIALRTGLRLEQITAKLETIGELSMDAEDFYKLAKTPTPALIADYPWLKDVLPTGASLEGFLWPATYRVLPDTTAEELVREMLDRFSAAVGDRMEVPTERKMTFYEVLSLASIVEREAGHDVDRPLIAGVYENRLNPKLWPRGELESDPTIFYVHDTLQLAKQPVPEWKTYNFWASLPKGTQLPADLPPELKGYNTYTSRGPIPGPICTPTVASIEAALAPDIKDKYLYFLAKADGSGDTVYAKTFTQHQANIAKYGPK
ncbi:MAG TPA: endolytic transglycosylase MltG [Candidatus Limnocylindrales bacterium]|nr:endolytic transglycosylase MltG [Candidatus Limnocylindrales bacterium]